MSDPRFAVPVPFADGEGAIGLLTRAAHLNGTALVGRLVNLYGLRRHLLTTGSAEEIVRLGSLAGYDGMQIERLLRWSGVPTKGRRRRFGEVVVPSCFIRGYLPPACPQCLAEAVRAPRGDPRPYLPADWFLPMVRSCVRHGVLLQRSHAQDRRADPSDLRRSYQLEPVFVDTTYDAYILGRLHGSDGGRTGPTRECDALDVHSVDRLCETIGQQRLQGERFVLSGAELADGHAAASEGFRILEVEGLEGHLRWLIGLPSKITPTDPLNLWGSVFALLRGRVPHVDLSSFHEMAFGLANESFPLVAGDVLFGREVPETRFRPLKYLSTETGVAHRTLRTMLGEAGLLHPHPNPMMLLTTEEVADEVIDKLSDTMSTEQVASQLDTTARQVESLCRRELLMPSLPSRAWGQQRKRFKRSDVEAFVQRYVVPLPQSETETNKPLHVLCRYVGVPLANIIRWTVDTNQTLVVRDGTATLGSINWNTASPDLGRMTATLASKKRRRTVSQNAIPRRLRTTNATSKALLRIGRIGPYDPKSLERFARTFVSSGELRRLCRLRPEDIGTFADQMGLQVAIERSEAITDFYLRREAEAVAERLLGDDTQDNDPRKLRCSAS